MGRKKENEIIVVADGKLGNWGIFVYDPTKKESREWGEDRIITKRNGMEYVRLCGPFLACCAKVKCRESQIVQAQKLLINAYLEEENRQLDELKNQCNRQKRKCSEIQKIKKVFESEEKREATYRTWCHVEHFDDKDEFQIHKYVTLKTDKDETLVIGGSGKYIYGNCSEERLDECKREILERVIQYNKALIESKKKKAKVELDEILKKNKRLQSMKKKI